MTSVARRAYGQARAAPQRRDPHESGPHGDGVGVGRYTDLSGATLGALEEDERNDATRRKIGSRYRAGAADAVDG